MATPVAITGTNTVCEGAITTFTDATAGGTWSTADATIASVNASSPVGVGGVHAGTTTISYTLGSGCSATRSVTVNTAPSAITGTTSACVGTLTTLSNTVGGGTWTSATVAKATIDASGVVSAVSAGTSVISYTIGSCRSTTTFTVLATPVAITGTNTVCEGAITTFTDATVGGTWSTADATIASVNASSPVGVKGVLAGVTTISYTLGSGCSATRSVTVNTAPAAINGVSSACVGTLTTLSNAVAGGTWTSATVAKATIDASGVVSAVSAGTSVISYTIGSCRSTTTFTVLATPVAITGTNTVCEGAITTFTDVTVGGTWSTADATIASVNASSPVGVGGVHAGTTTISYTLGTGCYVTRGVSVIAAPAAITGTMSACVGTLTTLSNSVAGGVWSRGTASVATISPSGVVTALAGGTTVIKYTIGSCFASSTFTVNNNPGVISGTNTVCEGAITTFSSGTVGGTWSTADATIASINANSPVGVGGVHAGTTTISYTLGSGCFVTRGVTVNTTPVAIAGTLASCLGTLTTLSDATAGGSWTSSTPVVATITASGVVSAVASGTSTISYTLGACRATAVFTSLAPIPAGITGSSSVCEGGIITLTDLTVGGAWSSSNTSVATINSSGVLTGILAGTTTVSYGTGCGAPSVKLITVNPTPSIITGGSTVCEGSVVTLSNTLAGGTWVSGSTSNATINASSGLLTGVLAGSANITYTVGTCTTSTSITINSTPVAIGGIFSSCQGTSTTLTDVTPSGTWSSDAVSVATISNSGVVNALSAGSANISYTLGTGCYATSVFTVNGNPSVITGTSAICQGTATTFANATVGGTWSTSDGTIASIDASSPVNIRGVSAGVANITYTLGTGCSATAPITVNPNPSSIGGTTVSCQGTSTTLTDVTPSGTWSSDAVSVATISNSGVVNALSAGTANISYTLGTGCYATSVFTVNGNPSVITGTSAICQGTATTFANAAVGGIWSTSDGTIASIDASSPVSITGVSAGVANITYTLGTGCYATAPITVNAQPAAIGGTIVSCQGTATTLTDATPSGTWASNDTSIVTISSGGVVNTVRAGTTNISYTLGTGCNVTTPFTVNANPAPINGYPSGFDIPISICQGSYFAVYDTTSGGTWSTSNSAIVTISVDSYYGNYLHGTALGPYLGTATITYTLPTGCYVTQAFYVTETPRISDSIIIAGGYFCAGNTDTLHAPIYTGSGELWFSNSPSVATISESGVLSALSEGNTTIEVRYAGCVDSAIVHVLPSPAAIIGTDTICKGAVTTLVNTTPGGTWSTSNGAIATISALSPVTIKGVGTGAANISYTLGSGCSSVAHFLVNASPSASITSAHDVCNNYSGNILFSGTNGDTITYNIDGGSNITNVLTGGTYSLSTGIVTSSHSYELVEVHNATCATTIDTFVYISPVPMQWVGGVAGHESDWANSNNWSCGFVPGDTTNVIIPSGTTYSPQITASSSVSVKNLTIASGATVTGGSSSFLYVKGALSNNGTYSGSGILSLNNSSAQTITGIGSVSNFQLVNTAGATINTGSRMTITNSLYVSNGTLTTHDSLVLASDSTYSARIAPIPFGGSISGNVRVMQYIPGGYRRYRFWSHPFSTSISLGQVENYIDITGTGGYINGFTTTGSNNPSAFRYNPLRANASLGSDPGWIAFTKINASAADTNLLHKYQGIRLFFRGIKGQGLSYATDIPSPATVAMVGPVNQGDQAVPLSKGSSANQDYNMIGNPYASPVDLGTVMYNAKAAGSITGTAFYVWNPYLGAGGQYETITIGSGAPTPYYMQANSCFQIRAAYNGAVINFTENDKAAAATTQLLKSSGDGVGLTISDANYHPWDMLSVKFNNSATNDEDVNFDAQKLSGADLDFYTLSAYGTKLAIDARPYNVDNVIPLGINTTVAQEYIIKADHVVAPGGANIYLHDKLLNRHVELTQGTEYRFTISKDDATQGNQRFELSMKPTATVAANTGFNVKLIPNPATDQVSVTYLSDKTEKVSVRILDISGVAVYSKELGTVQSGLLNISLTDFASGVYMVELTSGSYKSSYRLIKE